MKHFDLKLAAGAVFAAALAFAAPASAVPMLIDSSNNSGGNMADGFGAGFDGTTPAGASWSGAAPVVTPPPGSSTNNFLSPFANTDLEDTQSYFSVGGSADGSGGPSPMTLTFDTAQSAIDILWGSIDSYNPIEFLDGLGDTIDSYTGDTIVTALTLAGTPVNYDQVALISFGFDSTPFSAIRFTSTSAAFEFGLASAVPLPAAGWMLITALGGLGFMRHRRRAAA